MYRLFVFRNPLAYLWMVGWAILLRIPSFHPSFYPPSESFLITLAEQILSGFSPYQEVLTEESPLTVGLFVFIQWVFGDFTRSAVDIFTVVYIFICGFLFNQMFNDLKFQRERSLFPGMMFILITSLPWYAQELNGSLLLMLPMLLVVFLLIQTFEEGALPLPLLFKLGMLVSIAFLIHYQAIIFYLAIPLVYAMLSTPRIAEMVTMFIGMSIPLLISTLFLYFKGWLSAFISMSLFQQLDKLTDAIPSLGLSSFAKDYWELALAITFIFPAVLGMLAFRLGDNRLSSAQRKVESIMLVWLVTGTLMIIVSGFFRAANPLLPLVFPITFYLSRFFQLRIPSAIGALCFVMVLAFPTYSCIQYSFVSSSENFKDIPSRLNTPGLIWQKQQLDFPFAVAELKAVIHQKNRKPNGLILSKDPSRYLRAGINARGPLTDNRLLTYKLHLNLNDESPILFSGGLTVVDLWKALNKFPPDWIWDETGQVEEWKYFLPLYFSGWKKIKMTTGNIWLSPKSPKV